MRSAAPANPSLPRDIRPRLRSYNITSDKKVPRRRAFRIRMFSRRSPVDATNVACYKRRTRRRWIMLDRSILLPALIAAGLAVTTLPALAENGDHGLGRLIHQRLREGGPFFTGPEQAVINRACGYA